MKKLIRKKELIFLVIVFTIYYILHSTPYMALRTQVFLMGYPKSAFISEIIDDEYHNEVNKEEYAELNAKAYTLTKPPIEKETQGELRNFLVKKIGIFYLVKFLGDT
jgi:nitrate reductase NapE component